MIHENKMLSLSVVSETILALAMTLLPVFFLVDKLALKLSHFNCFIWLLFAVGMDFAACGNRPHTHSKKN